MTTQCTPKYTYIAELILWSPFSETFLPDTIYFITLFCFTCTCLCWTRLGTCRWSLAVATTSWRFRTTACSFPGLCTTVTRHWTRCPLPPIAPYTIDYKTQYTSLALVQIKSEYYWFNAEDTMLNIFYDLKHTQKQNATSTQKVHQ